MDSLKVQGAAVEVMGEVVVKEVEVVGLEETPRSH